MVDPGTPACVMVCKEHNSHGSLHMCSHHIFGSRDSRLSVQNSHSIVIVMDVCERFALPFSFPHSTSSSSPSWTFPPTSSGAPCISPICAQDPRKEGAFAQGATLLMSSTFILQSSRAQISTISATLASTSRSPPMLKLTTSTSGMRSLHHCSYRSAKQKPI